MGEADQFWASMGITTDKVILLGEDSTNSGRWENYKFFDGATGLTDAGCPAKKECVDTAGTCTTTGWVASVSQENSLMFLCQYTCSSSSS